jgi:S1-C subfamily serine protease
VFTGPPVIVGRRWVAIALLFGATSLAPGCARPAPEPVANPALDEFYVPVDQPPDPNLADNPVVAKTKSSVVKIRGLAYGCERLLTGSGFVVAPHRVMSNAHVIAGAESVSVELGDARYDAKVVSYDPYGDIAILDVPELTAPPLSFADSLVFAGTDAVMLGYPAGGAFVATPARIRDITELSSTDIYRTAPVTRQVYTVRGTVKQISGAPLVDVHAHVLGVVFGAAVDDPETGFVLTSDQIVPQLAKLGNAAPVATGPCVT